MPMGGRALAAVLLALAAGAVAAPSAEARFSVSPTVIHLDRQGGEAASGTFDVELGGEARQRFTVEVQDIVQEPDGSTGFAPPSDSPFSASNWLTVSPRRFAGGPNRTQPVRYSVRVPKKAPPGDHLTSLTVKRLPEPSDTLAQPAQAISVRMTVNVFGKARPSARIASFEAPGVSGGSPVEVSAVVENTGNVTLDFDGKQSGSISILQGDETKASEKLAGELYPGQSQELALAWDDPPLFGRLQARASVDAGGEPASESKSFFQVPWRQIGALVLVTLAATILVAGRRRGRF
jgi:hypothetical protein